MHETYKAILSNMERGGDKERRGRREGEKKK